MAPRSPRQRRRDAAAASVWSIASWLAAIAGSGLAGAGLLPWGIGAAIVGAGAASGTAALVTVTRTRPGPPTPPVAAPSEPEPDGSPVAAELAAAFADLDDPRRALESMLSIVGEAVGSDTVLLLTLTENGRGLTLEDPHLVEGRVPATPASMAVPVGDGGPLRMALASGTPIAADRTDDGPPTPWDRVAELFDIPAGAAVPLQTTSGPTGVLVVAGPAAGMPKRDLDTLHRLSEAAGPALAAMLRLRRLSRDSAASARTARFRSDYATVVGHELRTPLTTILGVLRTLTRPGMAPDNEDARDLVGMAVGQGERLKRLVEDMLAINQMDQGGVAVQPELVTLPDLIDTAVGRVAGAASLTTVTTPGSLPPVILDPEHTSRVLINLLVNAVKYGEESPIEVSASTEGALLVIRVVDHGPGLPPAAAAEAFDAFRQLNRTEIDAYGGIGLGLSISQGLVAAMGGRLVHEPTRGGGATFSIELPYKPYTGRRSAR